MNKILSTESMTESFRLVLYYNSLDLFYVVCHFLLLISSPKRKGYGNDIYLDITGISSL